MESQRSLLEMARSSASADGFFEHAGRMADESPYQERIMTKELIQAVHHYNQMSTHPAELRSCLIFCTGGVVAKASIALDDLDDYPDDYLQVDQFFPYGGISIRLLEVPGYGVRLPRNCRVFVSNGRGNPPLNEAVRRTCGHLWYGNVVFAMYKADLDGVECTRSLVNLGWAWFPVIRLILQSFMEKYLTEEQEMTV